VEIITKGDNRTNPEHFDPDVLSAFRKLDEKFHEIYSTFTD
jgi:putative two-component system response regulator